MSEGSVKTGRRPSSKKGGSWYYAAKVGNRSYVGTGYPTEMHARSAGHARLAAESKVKLRLATEDGEPT